MADETEGQASSAGQAVGADGNAAADANAGAQRQGPPPIQVLAQYVKDLSFENPNAPQTLMGGSPSPQIQVNVDVRTNKLTEERYEVILNLKADAKVEQKQAFLVELSYAALVGLNDVPKEHTAPALLVEVPRLLFPFARAVIAEATRNGGYPPMLVQPIDFAALFRRQMEALRQRQQAGADGETPPPSVSGTTTTN